MEQLYSLFLKSSGVCTDTRKIEKDCFFVALKGTNFNGNTFAEEAIKQGALCAIVDEVNYKTSEQTILVEDSLKFLQDLALYHRKQFTIPVIGITGSNGKTTSKELIAAVLSEQYNVHYTKGNLNNHIGVPLTLLALNKTHEIALIEMGANKFKDIAELCAIAEPTMGMITNIGKAHLEGFINFEGVLKTKKELYDSISRTTGKIIYNADDSILTDILPGNTKNISYGQNNSSAYISGELMEQTPFVQLQWSSEAYSSPTISTNLVGEYNFYNFLAAITFGRLFDVSPEKINHALSQYTPTNNRSQVNKTDKNTIIVDCYNANPTSMESAIRSFSMIEHDKKIAILGDMRELGHEEVAEHKKVLALLKTLKIDAILVGNVFSSLAEDVKTYASVDLLKEELENVPLENALVLLKGSRGIQLEKLLDVL
ncbi:MAG: UDP-N-acetylmuramoyl-tripeptide--D-alanyl-D-alanine ligase [Crocinitomicaceae bacterium]